MFKFIKRKIHKQFLDKKFSEILTGSIWALSARVISTFLGFVTSILIARYYGADILGIVAVVNSFLILACIFTVLGTPTSILRLIPEHLTKYSPSSAFKLYRKTQYIVICVSLLTGSLLFFGADLIAERLFSKPHLSYYFGISAIFVVFKSLMLLNNQAIRGLRLIKMFAFMQILPQGFNFLLLLALAFLWPANDVPVYALLGSFAITGLLGWFIMELNFKKIMQTKDIIFTISTFSILSISLPMLMTQTMTFIIGQTGVIMLGMFRSEFDVGFYSIAVKLATLTSFILNAINSMAASKFSELFHSGKINELFYVAKKSTKLIFWTTLPILLGFVVLGKPILHIAFGNEFVVAYPALVILVIGQFIHSVTGSTGLFMNMTGNQKVLRNIMFAAAIINVTTGYLLIPKFGILGAAIAAMVSIFAWNITVLFYIKKKYGQTTSYLPIFSSHYLNM